MQRQPDPDAPAARNPKFDAMWRGILEGTDPRYRNWRGWLQRLPASVVPARVIARRASASDSLTANGGAA